VLSFINMKRFTPVPAVMFTVSHFWRNMDKLSKDVKLTKPTCFTSGARDLSIPFIIDMKESNLPLLLIF
jgi:hypothetical protein